MRILLCLIMTSLLFFSCKKKDDGSQEGKNNSSMSSGQKNNSESSNGGSSNGGSSNGGNNSDLNQKNNENENGKSSEDSKQKEESSKGIIGYWKLGNSLIDEKSKKKIDNPSEIYVHFSWVVKNEKIKFEFIGIPKEASQDHAYNLSFLQKIDPKGIDDNRFALLEYEDLILGKEFNYSFKNKKLDLKKLDDDTILTIDQKDEKNITILFKEKGGSKINAKISLSSKNEDFMEYIGSLVNEPKESFSFSLTRISKEEYLKNISYFDLFKLVKLGYKEPRKDLNEEILRNELKGSWVLKDKSNNDNIKEIIEFDFTKNGKIITMEKDYRLFYVEEYEITKTVINHEDHNIKFYINRKKSCNKKIYSQDELECSDESYEPRKEMKLLFFDNGSFILDQYNYFSIDEKYSIIRLDERSMKFLKTEKINIYDFISKNNENSEKPGFDFMDL